MRLPVLWRASLRHALRHPWQFGLSLLGIVMGVAVVVAIDLANDSALRAFQLSVEGVVGKVTHQITAGPAGVPEAVYRRLRVEQGIRRSAPLIEDYVSLVDRPGASLTLIGVELFAERELRARQDLMEGIDEGAVRRLLLEPDAAVLSAGSAERLGVGRGARLMVELPDGRRRDLQVVDLLPERVPGALGDLLLMDIAAAQDLLNMPGHLSRIDLVAPPGEASDAWQRRVQAVLGPGQSLEVTEGRSGALAQMTRAFSLNLTMLSLLALVVGAFLIFNTMSFSVVQRRGLFGSLRTLGVTRRQVFRLVLMEALVLGLVGALLGCLVGIGLAEYLLGLVTRTINDLYYVLSVNQVHVDPFYLLKGLGVGVIASLVAAWLPAREAFSVTPRLAMNRSLVEGRMRRLLPGLALLGLAMLAASLLTMGWPGSGLRAGFVALLLIILGAALLAPGLSVAMARALRPLFQGQIGRLALGGVEANLSRTGVAMAALMVALSATVGMGIMVDSFRQTVDDWLRGTLQADIYVAPPSSSSRRSVAVVQADTLARIQAAPGIRAVSHARHVQVSSPRGPVMLSALSLTRFSYKGFRFVQGDAEQVWRDFESRDQVIVSEPFAYHQGLGPGDRLSLLTEQGEVVFKVTGVFSDYGSDRGVVTMSRATYDRHWRDPGISALGVYLEPGVDVDDMIVHLRGLSGADTHLLMRSNQAIREHSLAVFDRTFTVTVVLRLLATGIAFVGVLSALMAMQLERSRELATLRASGFTSAQIWRMVSAQTGLMGLMAGLLAVPLGMALALVLTLVINRRSFGWSLELHLDPGQLLQAPGMALLAALLAGAFPAYKMARTPPAEALREE